MKIKNHEILHEINRGAITTVYKARHLNLNRIVLLKVLNNQWLAEKDLIKRFKREAQICAHLQHSNIVNVYDFEISSDLVYISLEYIEGTTLSKYIQENHPIPADKIISIFYDVVSALEYAHEKGVIHRDIKPDNILIDEHFKTLITDFGLASFQDLPAVTEQGQGLGTPAYMAPEQIKGKKPSIQSDLYSLGITLYETITAEMPYQKANTAATLQSILSEELRKINDFRNDVPQWLVKLIHGLTEKKVEQRPESAGKILEEITKETGIKTSKVAEKSQNKIKSILVPSAVILFILISGFYLFWPSQGQYVQKQKKPQISLFDDTTEAINPVSKIIQDTQSVLNQTNSDQSGQISDNINGQKQQSSDQIAAQKNELSGFGSLFVVCTPWAEVVLDGDTVDITPMKQAITLSSGAHLLELLNPNYKREIHSIEIKTNINDTLNFRLKPSFGYLLVKATPWAKLYVNDQYKEDTPLEKSIIIPEGESILKLMNPRHGTITDTIFVEAGKTVEKTYTFVN